MDFWETIKYLINAALRCYSVRINLGGFSFTWLDVFIAGCLIGLITWIIRRIFE